MVLFCFFFFIHIVHPAVLFMLKKETVEQYGSYKAACVKNNNCFEGKGVSPISPCNWEL